MSAPAPYPLAWPEHLPRTPTRVKSQFRTGLNGAIQNVRTVLKAFAADSRLAVGEIVVSSNTHLTDEKPADPGVAVWFTWDGQQRCVAVDRYTTVQENLQAIYHVIEADRTKIRHAGVAIVQASYRGLAALAAPPPPSQVLGVPQDATEAQIHAAYRRLAAERHPDKPGGSHDAMAALSTARAAMLKGLQR